MLSIIFMEGLNAIVSLPDSRGLLTSLVVVVVVLMLLVGVGLF